MWNEVIDITRHMDFLFGKCLLNIHFDKDINQKRYVE